MWLICQLQEWQRSRPRDNCNIACKIYKTETQLDIAYFNDGQMFSVTDLTE